MLHQHGIHPDYKQSSLPKGSCISERQVQTIKKLFARCDKDNTHYYLALKELWATPINSNLQSPAELLFNRPLKTTLPVIIRPPHNSEAVRASLKSRQDYSRYDAYSKEKHDLLPTKPIWLQDAISKRWNPGVVKPKQRHPTPISSKHHKANTGETAHI